MQPMIHDDIPEIALGWHRAGRGVALATVTATWGSAPRPVGSLLAIAGDGSMAGSVSGGCVEAAVVAEALEAARDGRARALAFGVSDDDAFAVGLACGGRIAVRLDPVGGTLPVALLERLVDERARRRGIAHVIDTVNDTHRLDPPDAHPDRFRTDRSGFDEDGITFVAVHNPPLRMIVVGAVHIAQPLLAMARLAGYDATLVDPRPAFAATERFPDERIVDDWPDDALATLAPDARTAVVTLTHDPKLDDPAIRAALASTAFYLGCLGSNRTHAKRLERLADVAGLERIHAPVGLDIGARTPAEIAVSVMAEVTQTLRRD
jgi:xanthine dehydrogenase accessory factor